MTISQPSSTVREMILERWNAKDVKTLCKIYFGEELTALQQEIVRTVAYTEHHRVTICCMTRYGKSWSVSMGILLWIAMNPGKRIAIIAPTTDKTSIIRNYLAAFAVRSTFFLGLLDLDKSGAERIRKEVSRTRMTWKNGVEMRTLSAEGQGEALMGFGADLVVCDESCLINYEVYRSKISRMLGDNHDSAYVEIGNPLHRDNHFWEHWKNPDWHHVHIGYEEAEKEGRISKAFIDEQRATLTEREFEILYKADFPSTSTDALINWEWIERAHKARGEPPTGPDVEVVAGVDVAEQGNDLSVVTIGLRNKVEKTYYITHIESWGKTDLMPTVARITPLLQAHKVDVVRVDATGVGSGVYSRLDELKREGRFKARVEAFKGGLSPSNNRSKERFLNLKAESYWHTRSLFEEGKVTIPPHRDLVNQLSKMKWEMTSSEKIRIRDPGDKEGDTSEQKSPDFSDSLNIMLCNVIAPLTMGHLSFSKT